MAVPDGYSVPRSDKSANMHTVSANKSTSNRRNYSHPAGRLCAGGAGDVFTMTVCFCCGVLARVCVRVCGHTAQSRARITSVLTLSSLCHPLRLPTSTQRPTPIHSHSLFIMYVVVGTSFLWLLSRALCVCVCVAYVCVRVCVRVRVYVAT